MDRGSLGKAKNGNSPGQIPTAAKGQPDIQKLLKEGIEKGTKQVALGNQQAALSSTAAFLVKKRLALFFGSSGCPRNFTAVCPNGWTTTPDGLCGPPATSLCGQLVPRFLLDGMGGFSLAVAAGISTV